MRKTSVVVLVSILILANCLDKSTAPRGIYELYLIVDTTRLAGINGSSVVAKYSYDGKGQLIDRSIYDTLGGGPYMGEQWKYDDRGNAIEYSYWNVQSSETSRWRNEYDARGNIVAKAFLDYKDSVIHWRTYGYDAKDNVLWEKEMRADSTTRSLRAYTYDGSGRLLCELVYGIDSVIYWYEPAYDSLGWMTTRTRVAPDSTIIDWEVYEYDALRYKVRTGYYVPPDIKTMEVVYVYGAI